MYTKALYGAHAIVPEYQKRIFGCILDQIDIHIEVPCVDYEKFIGDRVGETSKSMRACVQAARDIQSISEKTVHPT
jgi:magnesium chelatase family protein